MKKLLSIEYTKLKKLNSLRIILLCYVVLLPLVMLFLSFGFSQVKLPFMPKQEEFYSFPTIWKFITYCASCLNVLVGVTIVVIVHNEMLFRTMKQNIIDGLTKREIIKSKLLVVLMVSCIVTLITFLTGLLIGGCYSGFDGWYYNIHAVFDYFLQTITYFTFAFFVAVLFKNAVLAIVFYVVVFPLETIVGIILNKNISETPYQFFPLNAFSKLTPEPFFKAMLEYMAAKGKAVWVMPAWGEYLLVFGYTTLFFLIAYRILKRRDI
jgi:ABC-2 type transport system permease protein